MLKDVSEKIVARELERARAIGVFGTTFECSSFAYPLLYITAKAKDGKAYRLRVDVCDYDERPPEIRVVRNDDVLVTDPNEHPTRNGGAFPSHPGVGLHQFICISGTRDYYTHPSHTGNSWLVDRPTNRLAEILQLIALKFEHGEWN